MNIGINSHEVMRQGSVGITFMASKPEIQKVK